MSIFLSKVILTYNFTTKMIFNYLAKSLLNIYPSVSGRLSPLMLFCFNFAWRAFTLFPYMFLATTMATGFQIRVEIEFE
ncbi:hypothetical protein BpHYR1_011486 [Brachionus plicatilis]|uniref:Uncharacterized protein n=1 Tax=Brachionus plicatilis TaxID=10195 RepID=A0A3M7S4A0_BRAPC|nr:hypothetical protein BpHYR1_011486 [Brachionus plicatilis]